MPGETVTGGQCRHRWDRVASFEDRRSERGASFEANDGPRDGTPVAVLMSSIKERV